MSSGHRAQTQVREPQLGGERSPTTMKNEKRLRQTAQPATKTAMSKTFISVLDLNNLPNDKRPESHADQGTIH